MKEYEFEIAFSFCVEDEYIVSQLNDRIKGRYSTFAYYEQQKNLPGGDGESKFKKVFRELARVVVILYRKKWGNTNWSRMEENAIRERAYKDGYNFTLFIVTENVDNMPDWLPRQQL